MGEQHEPPKHEEKCRHSVIWYLAKLLDVSVMELFIVTVRLILWIGVAFYGFGHHGAA